MEKPKIPIEPDIRDKTKYPLDERPMRDMTMEESENTPFIRDYRKYQKDKDEYPKLLERWEQLKFSKIIMNMTKDLKPGREDRIQKKIIEKFKIIKIK